MLFSLSWMLFLYPLTILVYVRFLMPKKFLRLPRSCRYSHASSSRSFIVLAFTFRFMIHPELLFRLSKLYTHCGAQTHDPEIKSLMLYCWASQEPHLELIFRPCKVGVIENYSYFLNSCSFCIVQFIPHFFWEAFPGYPQIRSSSPTPQPLIPSTFIVHLSQL